MQNCKFEREMKKQSCVGEVHSEGEGLQWTVGRRRRKV
jgi:hypothetical protein